MNSSPEFHIRNMIASDLDRVRELTAASFSGVSIDEQIERRFGPIAGHDWQWRKGRHIDDDWNRDPDGCFVLIHDGNVEGAITTWRDVEAGIGHIPNLAINGEFRGHGGGRMLIEHALQHFRDSGLTHARIETLVRNEVGGNLYPSMGFQEVARQIHYCREL